MAMPKELPGRRAPYASVSSLREFLERIRGIAVPTRVDRDFLRKLSVASNNEWALLSALKFLGIVDSQGVPTHAYRLLQTTDRSQDTLRHLVETAYKPLLDVGGANMSMEELQNYFRLSSSASQAKNAARFFRELQRVTFPSPDLHGEPASVANLGPQVEVPFHDREVGNTTASRSTLLLAKLKLLEKLPEADSDWTPEECRAVYDRVLEIFRNLDATL